jgi:2-keto-myo-inositol isomerase
LVKFAVNHMTVAGAPFEGLLEIASTLHAEGIELRNDLSGPLFDGLDAEQAGALVRARGLKIFALAEVKEFNDWSAGKAQEVGELMQIAAACGAQAISLIPRNNGVGTEAARRRSDLRAALQGLRPMLEQYGLIGLIEPLGFQTSSLRFKADIVDEIDALGAANCFKLVHDTFHHVLAGEVAYFRAHTGIIHISGVVDPDLPPELMQDDDRVLVDSRDRLQNIDQLRTLQQSGYQGVASFESFAPGIHELIDPAVALAASIDFVSSHLAEVST